MNAEAVKVTASHLARNAYLYTRQSTLKQVLHNTEAALRQYDLRGKAIALGWDASQITVIDIVRASPAPAPRTGKGSSSWSPRCRWAGPGSCSAWNAPGWPATTPTGISCWVRHEALCIRAEMEGLRRRAVAAVW